jgi:hypothetical protein
MHLQIRTVPARSPADLRAFLTVLADAGINIEAAGGGDVENGGEFAIAVAHGQEEQAMAVLTDNSYAPQLVDVDTCALTNEPGQLLACITGVSEKNEALGRYIRDVSIGVPDEEGRIQVQVYSVSRPS